jgi:predicted dehydrogenase
MMVGEMVRQGVFGDLVYAEGSYIHDCAELLFAENGALTWRGEFRRDDTGNCYPTHSLGPICKWLGINRTDWLATTATWQSKAASAAEYASRHPGADKAATKPSFWRLPDTVSTLIRTRNNVLIEMRLDSISPRPHHMNRYALQGTRASFTSHIDPKQEPLVWIADRSPVTRQGAPESWEPLYKYADEFEHPLWRAHREDAAKEGHGGGDYFILSEFVDAILENRPPAIDVYDAVAWSSIIPLSVESIENNNCSVAIPDFKRQS